MASVLEDAEYDSFWAAYRDCAVDATVQGAQDAATPVLLGVESVVAEAGLPSLVCRTQDWNNPAVDREHWYVDIQVWPPQPGQADRRGQMWHICARAIAVADDPAPGFRQVRSCAVMPHTLYTCASHAETVSRGCRDHYFVRQGRHLAEDDEDAQRQEGVFLRDLHTLLQGLQAPQFVWQRPATSQQDGFQAFLRQLEDVTRKRGHQCVLAAPAKVPEFGRCLGMLRSMLESHRLMNERSTRLKELLRVITTRDVVHGSMQTGSGGLALTAGGLTLGGIFFPPLLIAGTVIGIISASAAVGGAVEQIYFAPDHEKQLADIAEDLKMLLEESVRSAAFVRSSASVAQGIAMLSKEDIKSEKEQAMLAACDVVGSLASTIGTCTFPGVATAVSQGSSGATVPATASAVDAVGAPASSAAASSAVAGAGSSAVASTLLIGGGALNLAAGVVQLTLGIERLASGSATAQVAVDLERQADALTKGSATVVNSIAALIAASFDVPPQLLDHYRVPESPTL